MHNYVPRHEYVWGVEVYEVLAAWSENCKWYSSLPIGAKSKGKSCPCALTEHHAMEAYWGNGGIAPLIL
jgi:hypothetical protein